MQKHDWGLWEARFQAHPHRHPEILWEEVAQRLGRRAEVHAALTWMEDTGGEPDVLGRDEATGELLFCDFSPESPAGRRSLCYDPEALASRKENRPAGSAVGTAAEHGVELLDEALYARLQGMGEFDRKTSSWLKTPGAVRSLGGALFGDRRYGRVFTYHNGADSYYGARGFRALVRV